jgi:hypothetical protein
LERWNLHVSLPADIIQLVGPGSVPFVVAGSVLGVFELGERLASQRAKDALSKWLVSFDVQKAKALPDGTQELFERIFGERHFSLKCLIRSAVFSLGAMVFLSVLVLLIINPQEFFRMKDNFLRMSSPSSPLSIGLWLPVALWLPWSILIDYISLLKTRFALQALTRVRRGLITAAILGLDFVAYKLLFAVGIILTVTLMLAMNWGESFEDYLDILFGGEVFNIAHIITGMFTFYTSMDLNFIWFWAGFAPSIWMWLYVLALFVTRALLRSEKLITWLRWGLDVEKNPFRSIGAVAAALAFIASVAIILVSWEVSRISIAS